MGVQPDCDRSALGNGVAAAVSWVLTLGFPMASLSGGQTGAQAGTAPQQWLWGRETASASLAASPTGGAVTASCAPECSHCSGTSSHLVHTATNSLQKFSKRQSCQCCESYHQQSGCPRSSGQPSAPGNGSEGRGLAGRSICPCTPPQACREDTRVPQAGVSDASSSHKIRTLAETSTT